MKKESRYLPTLLLIVIIFTIQTQNFQSTHATQTTLVEVACTGKIEQLKETSIGINYLSLYHMYSKTFVTDEVLNRDFSKFRQDGINIISLSLYWYRLEGNIAGDYNGTHSDKSLYGDAFLDDVKHVISVADQNGLKVLVTIHTLWGDDSPWCTPDYIIDPETGKNIGLAIVRSNEMREAFTNMVNHTVTYLADTKGIWAWAMLNEPWYWGRDSNERDFITNNGKTQKENFITLFEEVSSIIKEIDGRPSTIRFCSTHMWIGMDNLLHVKNIFAIDWGWDQRIFNSVDFVSFNVYMPMEKEIQEQWTNITMTNIITSTDFGKEVWITEFGCNINDDIVQSEYVEKMVSLFRSLPIKGWIAWFWEGDKAPDGWKQNPGQFGKACNLCATEEGIARPAYYSMM